MGQSGQRRNERDSTTRYCYLGKGTVQLVVIALVVAITVLLLLREALRGHKDNAGEHRYARSFSRLPLTRKVPQNLPQRRLTDSYPRSFATLTTAVSRARTIGRDGSFLHKIRPGFLPR